MPTGNSQGAPYVWENDSAHRIAVDVDRVPAGTAFATSHARPCQRSRSPYPNRNRPPEIASAPNPISLEPGASCYKFILLRPKDQRATAVQARLKQADAMVAALERTITVDLVGDHANILSLQFPMRWPAPPS